MATNASSFISAATGAIQEQELSLAIGDAVYASTALLVYTHALTFAQEVENVWRNPLRPSSLLYILIRYPALVGALVGAGINSYTPNCNSVLRFGHLMVALALAACYAFQIMRTHAVWGRGRGLAFVLTLVCLPAVVCELWTGVTSNCAVEHNNSLQTNIQYASELAFSSIVLSVTLWRIQSISAQQRVIRTEQGTLAKMILKSELTYYFVLIVCDTGTLVSNNIPVGIGIGSQMLLWAFREFNFPLRWILLSQAMLDLQQHVFRPARPPARNSTYELTTSGSEVIEVHNTVMDQLRASLCLGVAEEETVEGDEDFLQLKEFRSSQYQPR